LIGEAVGVALPVEPRIEAFDEQFDERPCDVRMRGERFFDVLLAVERAELSVVAAVRAQ
jgi:hypothetical protein